MIASARMCRILLGVFCLLGSGCGLISIPRTRVLPEPVRVIELLDVETEAKVQHAETGCFITPYENWANSFPPYAWHDVIRPGDDDIVLSLVPDAGGRFSVETIRKTAYVKPYGITPLGFVIFEDYYVTITARAEGYMPFLFRYYPVNMPVGEHRWDNGSKTVLTETGVLQLHLVPTSSP